MKRHIIYITGLGDNHSYGQNVAISLWRLYGLTPHYLPMYWEDKEAFQPKLNKIIKKVDELKTKDNQVSLLGVSAGASAALNAYVSSDKISGMIWLCGKINNPQIVNPAVYERNPAFKESMDMVKLSLTKLNPKDLSQILSIHSSEDNTVPAGDSVIEGVREQILKSKGHFKSISYGVLTGGLSISKFLKSLDS